MAIVISPKIEEKLATKHKVTVDEVAQCFANRAGKYLLDPRAKHATNPPTEWFISETDYGRKLKIAFVPDSGNVYIRSAFPPDENELRIYNKYAY